MQNLPPVWSRVPIYTPYIYVCVSDSIIEQVGHGLTFKFGFVGETSPLYCINVYMFTWLVGCVSTVAGASQLQPYRPARRSHHPSSPCIFILKYHNHVMI